MIWNHIVAESYDAADQVFEDLLVAMRAVAENPQLGHYRRDVHDDGLRCINEHSYVIVYDPRQNPLQIVRVVHGARDVEAILGR